MGGVVPLFFGVFFCFSFAIGARGYSFFNIFGFMYVVSIPGKYPNPNITWAISKWCDASGNGQLAITSNCG